MRLQSFLRESPEEWTLEKQLKWHGTPDEPEKYNKWGGPSKRRFEKNTGMKFSLENVKKAWGTI